MAQVRSVGAVVSLNPWAEEDSTIVDLNIRLFADLEGFRRVIDPGPQSTELEMNTQQARTTLSYISDSVRGVISAQSPLPMEHRASMWAALMEELEKEGVKTHPETLQALPFHLEFHEELIRRFDKD